jgi:polyferredoxin
MGYWFRVEFGGYRKGGNLASGRRSFWESVIRTFYAVLLFFVLAGFVFAQEEVAGRRAGIFEFWLLPRVWMSGILALLGMVLLAKSWVGRNFRTVVLAVIFLVFAVVWTLPLGSFARGMAIHPSPMCIVAKPFLFLEAGRGVPVVFISLLASIAVLTIVGNKLFCGWVCPIGALQELVHRIPVPKVRLPFRVTNWIRVGLFVVFVVVAFRVGVDIYAYFNPFESLHWGFEVYGLVVLGVTVAAGLFVFRPFCYMICPLGLLTWVLEHLSIVRVSVDRDACTECGKCVEESYCPAVGAILDQKKSRPDCHVCGRCMEICPEDALKYK